MKRRLTKYIFLTILFYSGLTYMINSVVPPIRGVSSGSLIQKTEFYMNNSDNFDLLFIGDSRTYCGFDPDLLDTILGSRSYNLAHWANWFPTQYAQFETIISEIPSNTTVVWTIGHQNFFQASQSFDVKTNFPIGIKNLPRYLNWGFSYSDLKANLHSFAHQDIPFAIPTRSIVEAFRLKLDASMNQVDVNANQSDQPLSMDRNGVKFDSLKSKWVDRPNVISIQRVIEGSLTTSAAVRKRNGNYRRVEIEGDFFREKQMRNAQNVQKGWSEKKFERASANEIYWENFSAILGLFQKHGVNLVVNEIEEAPNAYGNSSTIREYYQQFMDTIVRPHVEKLGIPYVKADFSILSNEDYFDYNHLNSMGIQKYDSMMVGLLQPFMESR